MPYASDAQRRYFHAAEARGDISHKTVAEFDEASKGKKLPEHAKGKGHAMKKESGKITEGFKHSEHGAEGSHEHTRHGNKGHVAHKIHTGSPEELEAYHGGGHDGYTHKK